MFFRIAAVVCTLLVGSIAGAGEQTPARERQGNRDRDNSSVAQGWSALEAGRYQEAVSTADAILQRRPHDHAAVVLKIRALARSADIEAALAAYDAWSAAHRVHDLHLLGVAAEAMLQQIGESAPEIRQRVAALEALAERGDKSAAEAVARLGQSAGIEGQVALARLGDAPAAEAVAKKIAANTHNPDMVRQLGAVKAPAVENQLVQLLGDSDPATRATAADALAQSGTDNAAEPLLKALKDPDATVQQSAAVALAALGRPDGRELVDRLLQSGIPDIVLSVAEALPGDPGRWQAVVTPLLDTENPVDRLRAARVLGKNAPADANRVLAAALSDENIAVREEAARSLADVPVTENAPDWRRLLSDQSPWVRLEAAKAIWRQVTE